jgi:cytochrome c oxidase subunit III
MPTILTPHDTERRNRIEDHGAGRRPPTDKRTGGGGSGDNDNWGKNHEPRSRLIRYRMGIFSALAGDMIFFAALVVAFFATRSNVHVDAHNNFVNEWRAIVLPRVLWWNTAVLLLSSATMEIARRRMFRETDVMEEWLGLGKPTSNHSLPWLFATTGLGLFFLAGQWKAWLQIAAQPVYLRASSSSHFFYLITGIHAAHLFLGIVGLNIAIVSLYRAKQVETRQIFVDCAAWYWHSMGLFWIFLFILLAYFQ